MVSRLVRGLSATAFVLVALVAAMSIGLFSGAASEPAAPRPIQETFAAAADAWVNQAAPDTKYGAEDTLVVGRSELRLSQYDGRTLVAFDVSSIARGSVVVSATLELYQTGATGAKGYNVWPHAITERWDELKVTWNDQPTALLKGEDPTLLDSTNGWKAWDVTNTVRNWVSGEWSNYGLLLRGDGDTIGAHEFVSRHVGRTGPRLLVSYLAASSTATPSATATPQHSITDIVFTPRGRRTCPSTSG